MSLGVEGEDDANLGRSAAGGSQLFEVVGVGVFEPVDERATYAGSASPKHVVECGADQRGRLPVVLADVVQPLQDFGVDDELPVGDLSTIMNALYAVKAGMPG